MTGMSSNLYLALIDRDLLNILWLWLNILLLWFHDNLIVKSPSESVTANSNAMISEKFT
jgi:hypothetical protein